MMKFKITLERRDGTWALYDFEALGIAQALRHVARSYDIEDAKQLHVRAG